MDDEARGIFQGKVIVRQDAQKTDGQQSSHALLLSPTAEFDAKPELEIYADDVVCGHGATSGELDDNVAVLSARPRHSRGKGKGDADLGVSSQKALTTLSSEAVREEALKAVGRQLAGTENGLRNVIVGLKATSRK